MPDPPCSYLEHLQVLRMDTIVSSWFSLNYSELSELNKIAKFVCIFERGKLFENLLFVLRNEAKGKWFSRLFDSIYIKYFVFNIASHHSIIPFQKITSSNFQSILFELIQAPA